jgi:hypothetical protein
VKVILRHFSDFRQFLQLKAFEGYPDKPGSKDVAQNVTISLTDIGEKLGWGERKVCMAQWPARMHRKK